MAGNATTLPARIPIFPLSGVLLLPRAQLPLNIFEPRYLDMVRDAMAGERIIGMVQPLDPGDGRHAPPVYPIGGAGRITAFEETQDGRFLITLTGCCRFRIAEELDTTTKYRQVVADWGDFAGDLTPADCEADIDRARLTAALQIYLRLTKLSADWDAIEAAPTGPLVDNLAMICPFDASEKQALLESYDLAERARILIALLEMAVMQHAGGHIDDGVDGKPPVH
jgi:Lon protease-like protein